MKRLVNKSIALMMMGVALAACSETPTTFPAHTFKVGDVVDLEEVGRKAKDKEWPGAFHCFGRDSSPSQLQRTIKEMQTRPMGSWERIPQYCEPVDVTYAYEIVEIADGPAEYGGHFYRVYEVANYPVNKDPDNIIWAAFPADHATLSECKPSPAYIPVKPKKKTADCGPCVDASTPPSHVLPCQKFKQEKRYETK